MRALTRYKGGIKKDYSCADVRRIAPLWKENWRRVNGTDALLKAGRTDKAYDAYCHEIDSFLADCPPQCECRNT